MRFHSLSTLATLAALPIAFQSRADSLATVPFQTANSFGCFLLNAGGNDLDVLAGV